MLSIIYLCKRPVLSIIIKIKKIIITVNVGFDLLVSYYLSIIITE